MIEQVMDLREEVEMEVADRAELLRYEAVIGRGLQTFIEVGNALAAIRDSRLYRDTHATFLDYCRERWGLGKSHVYRLMDAAEVAGNLAESSPIGEVGESVLRPLTTLEPDQQREAWADAVEDAGGKQPTAAHVEKAAVKFAEPKPLKARPEPVAYASIHLLEGKVGDWLLVAPEYIPDKVLDILVSGMPGFHFDRLADYLLAAGIAYRKPDLIQAINNMNEQHKQAQRQAEAKMVYVEPTPAPTPLTREQFGDPPGYGRGKKYKYRAHEEYYPVKHGAAVMAADLVAAGYTLVDADGKENPDGKKGYRWRFGDEMGTDVAYAGYAVEAAREHWEAAQMAAAEEVDEWADGAVSLDRDWTDEQVDDWHQANAVVVPESVTDEELGAVADVRREQAEEDAERSERDRNRVAHERQSSTGKLAVHFSSDTPEHYTPKEIIEAVLDCLGNIDLDPCSNSHEAPNVPAGFHFTQADDGLSRQWAGRVYLNPPYGREIGKWVEKLCSEYEAGRVTEAIALVPARTDTDWFDRLIDGYKFHCFVHGRLQFVGNDGNAPFPSAIVYLGTEWGRFYQAFRPFGRIVQEIHPQMFGQ